MFGVDHDFGKGCAKLCFKVPVSGDGATLQQPGVAKPEGPGTDRTHQGTGAMLRAQPSVDGIFVLTARLFQTWRQDYRIKPTQCRGSHRVSGNLLHRQLAPAVLADIAIGNQEQVFKAENRRHLDAGIGNNCDGSI